uniref:Uncharacterized protein n=1 Tax=Candidatus Nitrotoga fabula TaxID=2182327 RepID=A0A2X0SFL1_9PROT|nr:protein of unknown function [Candidatus Nitrotoga fabula]
MDIVGITLNLTNTTVSVLVIVAVVLYTWFTQDRDTIDDRDH